jgi:hypothetical protein
MRVIVTIAETFDFRHPRVKLLFSSGGIAALPAHLTLF